MSFYDSLARTASKLLVKYGQEFVFTANGESINPVTGALTGSNADYVVNGLFKSYPTGLIDGTRIQMGDRMLVIDNTREPEIDDQVTISSKKWNVVSINTSNPAGTDLVYVVQVRK